MPMTVRTLLIVEDDRFYNLLHTKLCKEAIQELVSAGMLLEGYVQRAFSYAEAREILVEQVVDFVAVDLALSEQEEGFTEEERRLQDVGGIYLLRDLQEVGKRPIMVVISGERLQSYAVDAYRRFGVLAFYQKLDMVDYGNIVKSAVKAALYYLQAVDLLQNLRSELDIEAALQAWKQAVEAGKTADIADRHFPENLGYKIRSVADETTNAVTHLPNARWTEKRLATIQHTPWSIVYVTIQGFNQFVNFYKNEEKNIMVFVARILKTTRQRFDDLGLFIGHLGHWEYNPEPSFILIPSISNATRASEMAYWITQQFAEVGHTPFTSMEHQQEMPTDLTFRVFTRALTSDDIPFNDLPDFLIQLGYLGHEEDTA